MMQQVLYDRSGPFTSASLFTARKEMKGPFISYDAVRVDNATVSQISAGRSKREEEEEKKEKNE